MEEQATLEGFSRSVRGRFVDCYVSTDASEIVSILKGAGYTDMTDNVGDRPHLFDEYCDSDDDLQYASLREPKMNLEIDCSDIPLGEATDVRRQTRFMPMSKLRVYTNGSPNVAGILLPILKALDAERQNMAFVTDTDLYVHLSEFYC